MKIDPPRRPRAFPGTSTDTHVYIYRCACHPVCTSMCSLYFYNCLHSYLSIFLIFTEFIITSYIFLQLVFEL